MSEIPNANPTSNSVPPVQSRFSPLQIGKTLLRFTRNGVLVIGATTILLSYAYLSKQYKTLAELSNLPPSIVLKLSLDNGVKERHQAGRYELPSLTGVTPLTLREITHTLDMAAKDARVKALYVELPDYRSIGGLAQVQELRDKIEEFKKANKVAVVYSNEYNQYNYYLASSFTKLFMLPVGHLWLTGLHNSTYFFKDMLAKLEISPKFAHAGDFKTAPNMFTHNKFTPEHRQQVEGILMSVYSQLLAGIGASRDISVDNVNKLVNSGPHFAVDAKQKKLIDGLYYEDEVLSALKILSDNGEIVPFRRYAKLISQVSELKKTENTPQIALIYGVGSIAPDVSESPEPGVMTPKLMAKAFNAAIEDKNVKAIVLRVDSPGGSAVASDAIWRNIVRAQKAGKRVIASIGNVAASGGYYIIAPCDKIVAQPGSLTGSIGVFGGKVVVRKFLENFGVTEDSVKIGENADAMSAMDDFTPAQWERFQSSIESTYEIFLDRVSQGRKIEKNALLHIAGGRVFTGEQAMQVGLIDEFGGLDKAIQIAKSMSESPDARVVVFPPKQPFWKQVQQMMDGETPSMNVSLSGILENEMREMWGNTFGVHPWLFSQMLAKPTIMTMASNIPQDNEKKE